MVPGRRYMPEYKWRPIEDLPPDWPKMASEELKSLSGLWQEQKHSLEKTETLKEFHERLKRSWSIETGVIERVYTIDRGTTQLLVEHGLNLDLIPKGKTDKSPEEVIRFLRDHANVYDGLMDFVGQNRRLTTGYIKELHAALMRSQKYVSAVDDTGQYVESELKKGDWKTLSNNPITEDETIHEYCPPEHVASEMDRLCEIHQKHEDEDVPPEIEAAWIHHRFTQIHPFQDGNGRVARAVSNLIFLRSRLFPVVIFNDLRESYLDVLEKADSGDLSPLVDFMSERQKKSLLSALGLVHEVAGRRPVLSVIEAAGEKLRKRKEEQAQKMRGVFEFARKLQTVLSKILEETEKALKAEFRRLPDEFADRLVDAEKAPKAEVMKLNLGYDVWRREASDAAENSYYYKAQIVNTAQKIEYWASLSSYRAWNTLQISNRDREKTTLLFSFHGYGPEFRGIMACSCTFFAKAAGGGPSEEEFVQLEPSCSDIFQFNYLDDFGVLVERFKLWVEESLVIGLELWRKSL